MYRNVLVCGVVHVWRMCSICVQVYMCRVWYMCVGACMLGNVCRVRCKSMRLDL